MKLDRRLLRLVIPARRDVSLAVLFGWLAGILIVLQARELSRTITAVFLFDHTLNDVRLSLWILLAVSLGRAACRWGIETAGQRAACQVKRDLRARLLDHVIDLGPTFTKRQALGELSNTLLEGVEALDAYFRQFLPQLAEAVVVPITFLLIILPIDLTSGLVMLLTAPLIPLFMILIGDAAERQTRRQWRTLSRMSAFFLESIQGLKTLKLLGRSADRAQEIESISDQHRHRTMHVLRTTFLSALALEWVATLSVAVVAVQIGLRLLYGRMDFREALIILFIAPEFYLPLRLLGARFHAAMAGTAAGERIFGILEGAPSKLDGEFRRKAATPQHPCSISFKEVSYSYPSNARRALQNISFDLPADSVAAVVGPSGCGKSTLAHLLLRFIEPDQGQITVEGIPLGEIAPNIWRDRIAWVPQQPSLLNGTVAENLRLAHPDAGDRQLRRAAELAHAMDFIDRLPHGLETVVGERGEGLSSGQIQRLALARAFLRDAPLLIFDEATAHIDPEHEALLLDSMQRLLHGRTALVIAHRLPTVQNADVILVMRTGPIVETGTHTQLRAAQGLYDRFWRAYEGMI
jgi:ATP-binding cassette subfamily C protein CydD